MPLNEDISAAIRPIIEASGNYLEELTITSAGKVKILTVIVDSDSHLNLDQITAVTKEISEVIEALEELGDSAFTLEVTSPGIDRPLTKPRHWRKNFDRLVKITMISGQDIQGRIGEATETTVFVGDQKVSFEDIKRAVLEIEFK
ncbi:MAG: ribosome maturation factor RimP [Actinobacteria bacterium]|jgi:ribosome maturation factor RimP|nr:ribosome maturation factor RimP [Actinomycetota bacterium]MDA2981326.1 ribosome maturation factor RimP [Actinomycetota bacterium]MDA2996450.1 ribosome maturation factor RimP [Actinomycetota bacterium]